MKRTRASLALVVIALLALPIAFAHCAKKPPTLTPAAAQAFDNHRVQNVLDVVRDVAVDANSAGRLSVEATRRVVRWHASAITIVHALGSGWQQTVVTSLDEALKNVTPPEAALLTPYVTLAKSVIGGVR